MRSCQIVARASRPWYDRPAMAPAPRVIILAGPNGAGKTTAAPLLLRGTLRVEEFVNADVIATGLSAFAPERAAIAAGRIMLARLKELAAERADFAFETTLASRTFAPWIAGLRLAGYRFHLVFLFLPSAEMAVARVARRVSAGGHDVPEETIRRRYEAGLVNFFARYRPMATTWQVHDSSRDAGPRLIAAGGERKRDRIVDPATWGQLVRRYGERSTEEA